LAHHVSDLSTVDRLGLQNDAFALAKSGLIPTSRFLSLAAGYSQETDFTVWSDLTTSLGSLESVFMEDADIHRSLMSFIQKLYSPIFNNLGWVAKPNESPLDTMLRPVILVMMAKTGDAKVIAEAKARFTEYKKNASSLPPDLRSVVYKIVVSSGRTAEFEEIKKIFLTADMHEEKLRALRALGAASDPTLLQQALQMSFSPDVRSHDIYLIVASVATNPNGGRQAAWSFFQERFADYQKSLGDSGLLLSRTVSLACKDFASDQKAQEVEQFFAKNPVPQAERTIKQSLEEIRTASKWHSRSRQDVIDFLKQN